MRVPTYDNTQVQARGLGAPTVGGVMPDNSGLQRGIASIGNAAQRFADQEREKADTAAIMEADRQLTEWQLNTMYNPENGVFNRKGKAALNVTGEVLGQFEQTQSKLLESLTNERQKARFQQIVASRRNSLSNDLNRYEYGERQRYYDDVDKGQIDTSLQGAALAYQDPEKVGYFRSKIEAVIRSQAQRKGLPEEATQAALLKGSSAVESAVVARMADDDPYKAKEYFAEAQTRMTADDQVRVGNLVDRAIKAREVEVRQLQAIARAELNNRVTDASTAYLQGLEFENPPKREDFDAAYGAEEGAERFAKFQRLEQVGGAIRELATASPEDRQKIIESYRAGKDGVASDGFKFDAELEQMVTNAAVRLFKEMETDPAQYAAKYSPEVARTLQAVLDGDEGATDIYAAATLGEQQRLGIRNPSILPRAQAEAIAARFVNLDDGSEGAGQMIRGLSEQWGSYWPVVYKQLSKDLPPAALIIGSGVDPLTEQILSRTATLKTEELKRGIESADITDVNRRIDEEFAEFGVTMNMQGGERTYATILDQAKRLAYVYMGQGTSVKDAAEKAYDALVGDKYTMADTYRVPVEYDFRMVARAAEQAKAEIDSSQIEVAVPPGLTSEFVNERVQSAIQREGYWVTNEDETGLVLFVNGSAVTDRNGNRITRTFEELTAEGAELPMDVEFRGGGGL